MLSVQDQGVGIPTPDMPRIFGRFRGSRVAGLREVMTFVHDGIFILCHDPPQAACSHVNRCNHPLVDGAVIVGANANAAAFVIAN